MRTRQGARILIQRPDGRVLLFRFKYDHGPLAGREYWAVPGGGVEPGEAIEAAAVRELFEETGISVASVGSEVATGGYQFRLSSGEEVWQEDHYFLLRLAADPAFSRDGLTEEEQQSLVERRWWLPEEMRESTIPHIPADLPDIAAAAVGPGHSAK